MKTIAVFCLLWQAIIPVPLPARAAGSQAESFHWQQYSRPAEAGWSAELLEKARVKAESMGSTAVMAVFRGHVLAAWGDIARRCPTHSVRKSMISALIGIQVAAATVNLEETVGELGIDDLQPLTLAEKQATIRDLLCSRSGIYHPAAKETRDMKKLRPVRGSHAPGEFWYYNNWDFNVLGEILEQQARTPVAEEFRRRIAAPLAMQDFRLRDVFPQYERSLSRYPAHTFRLSARDLARLGQLYLQDGSWRGIQVLPADWIRQSWTTHTQVSPEVHFGYSWWINPRGPAGKRTAFPQLYRHDRYAAWGSGGQLLLIIPDADLVFVHLADTDTGNGVSGKKIWELAEMVLAARIKPGAADPQLAPPAPQPFKGARPAATEHREIQLELAKLREYAGMYRLGPNRVLSLRLGDDILIGGLDGREVDFFPGARTYFFARAENMQIAFHPSKKGRATGLTFIYRGKPIRAKRIG